MHITECVPDKTYMHNNKYWFLPVRVDENIAKCNWWDTVVMLDFELNGIAALGRDLQKT